MRKQAFVVFSGPSELGKVFHALTYAKQAKQRGDQTELYFAGEGTHWPEILAKPDHPVHGLFKEVQDLGIIEGACQNCANAFGTTDSAKNTVGLVQGPEASFGQIDVLGKEDQGYRVWTF